MKHVKGAVVASLIVLSSVAATGCSLDPTSAAENEIMNSLNVAFQQRNITQDPNSEAILNVGSSAKATQVEYQDATNGGPDYWLLAYNQDHQLNWFSISRDVLKDNYRFYVNLVRTDSTNDYATLTRLPDDKKRNELMFNLYVPKSMSIGDYVPPQTEDDSTYSSGGGFMMIPTGRGGFTYTFY